MVNSKFYTAEEMEQLKLRILASKNILYSLKAGTSREEYLQIKNQFEEMKKKILEMDSLQDDVEEMPLTRTAEQKSQVAQFTHQLTSLNQMVEEIIAVLATLIPDPENKEVVDEVTLMATRRAEFGRGNEATSIEKQATVINQPSYRQLKKFANEVSHLQIMEEGVAPLQQKNYLPSQLNTAFFQSLHKQTNNHASSLQHNMPLKKKTRMKSANEMTVISEKNQQLPHLNSESENELPPISISNPSQTRPVTEHSIDQPQPQPEQTDIITDDKKQKSNSFFDFFRK